MKPTKTSVEVNIMSLRANPVHHITQITLFEKTCRIPKKTAKNSRGQTSTGAFRTIIHLAPALY